MKKTKVKINFNINDRIKLKVNKVKSTIKSIYEKIKTNISNNKGNMFTKQNIKYYSLLGLMIIVAVVSTYANILEYQKVNKEEYVIVENANIETNSSNIEKEEALQVNNNEEVKDIVYKTAISSISSNATNYYENNTTFPVNGKVIQEFAQDKVIYYDSLGVWKTHSGVDIECETNSEVTAVIDGKVIGIYKDDVFGYSVIIEGEKYVCVYSSLEKEVLVSIGDVINKGDIIGKAGTNPAEANLGTHLHFELMLNGEYINPSTIGIK